MTWLRRPICPGWDKVSAIFARRSGSSTRVKQLPSFVKPIPAARAAQATYSWPLRMTCAPNGGCPLILIVRCPQVGSMMWKE